MRALILSTVIAAALSACGPPRAPSAEAPSAASPSTSSDDDAAALHAAIAALPAPYNEADFTAGRRVFGQCRSCHTIDPGAPNRVGPNLHGLMGRRAGAVEGFNYSEALETSSFAWDAERLDSWLRAPQSFLPGNRMAFAGVRDETQRRDLIAYIEVMSAR